MIDLPYDNVSNLLSQVIYALWVCIVINCCIATTLAIVYKSIYTLL